MKKIILVLLIGGIFAVSAVSVYAHSGRTNAWGCHYNHKTGGYHCH